jgi:hypothetical protein
MDSVRLAEVVWTYDGDSYQWVEVAASGFLGRAGYTGSIGVTSSVFISDTAPVNPELGKIWLDSTSLNTYLYYTDGSNYQWIEVAASGTGYTGSAGTGQTAWQVVSSSTTVVANNGYFVDTTGSAVALTLPATADIGNTIRFNDLAGNFAVNNLTILRNGHKIQGVADDLLVADTQASFGLVYSNATYGWKIMEV